MPLSDEEMRLLEQMERALVEEDPKFASTLRGTTFARATRLRVIVSAVVFVIGVVVLMTGAVTGGGSGRTVGIVVGIVGFVLMLVSATIGLSAWRGRQVAADGHGQENFEQAPDSPAGLSLIQGGRTMRKPRRSPDRTRRTKGSFMQRMEQRWQNRRNQNGL